MIGSTGWDALVNQIGAIAAVSSVVPSWVSDSAVLAGALSVMIGCIFAAGQLLKALAHVAEIPERLDRLDSKVDAFGTRLDEHLIAEEAAIHALTAQLELVAERRTTPRS